MSDEQWITKSGKVLTDEDIQALADEAEAGYDVSQLQERYVMLRAADFRRMIAPRAMNYATSEAHRDEWVQLVAGTITKLRENLIMEQAADQMYVWADTNDSIWMDCPDLRCEHAILLGNTPNLAQIREAAREHVNTAHGGGPIVLVIEPEQPVSGPESGDRLVDPSST